MSNVLSKFKFRLGPNMSDNYTFGKGLLSKLGHQVSSKNEKRKKIELQQNIRPSFGRPKEAI